MIGSSVDTGKKLSGIEHLRQSIADILSTPIGSRVMRRDYGSRLFELIDRPLSPAWYVDCYAWAAEALDRWEPRFRLDRIEVVEVEEGHPTLRLEGSYLPEGKQITLEGIVT